MSTPSNPVPSSQGPPHYPRVIITYCTQCKWLLRAAYHAQELLSTFSTSLGEVSLRPATGGVYWVDVELASTDTDSTATNPENKLSDQISPTPLSYRIWDRKVQDGFPETKILKRLVRDLIDPGRGLGHVDREHGSGSAGSATVVDSTNAHAIPVETKQAPSLQEAKLADVATLDGGPSISTDTTGNDTVSSGKGSVGDNKGSEDNGRCEDCA